MECFYLGFLCFQIVTSSYTDLQDYTYYFVPAPWLCVKLLRLLQNYPPPGDWCELWAVQIVYSIVDAGVASPSLDTILITVLLKALIYKHCIIHIRPLLYYW